VRGEKSAGDAAEMLAARPFSVRALCAGALEGHLQWGARGAARPASEMRFHGKGGFQFWVWSASVLDDGRKLMYNAHAVCPERASAALFP